MITKTAYATRGSSCRSAPGYSPFEYVCALFVAITKLALGRIQAVSSSRKFLMLMGKASAEADLVFALSRRRIVHNVYAEARKY